MGDVADYVKYVTERIVTYWEKPKETPEARRERRRKREPWMLRWFGHLLPIGIIVWWKQRRLASRRTETSDSGFLSQGHPE